MSEDIECTHDDLECGYCIDCGSQVDWIERIFKNVDKD